MRLILWNIEEDKFENYGGRDNYPVKNDGVLACRSHFKDFLDFAQQLFLYLKIPMSIVN